MSTATLGPVRRARGLFTPRRLVISVLLAVAGVALPYAFISSPEPAPPRMLDAAVRRVFPEPGRLEIRQVRVGAELVPGYTGVLQIDGREIPEDQLERPGELGTENAPAGLAALGVVAFTPGPGKEIEALSPARHCATVVFWQEGTDRDAARRYQWCFNVH